MTRARFGITLDGQFTVLHWFGAGEGGFPSDRLVEAGDGNLYGSTSRAVYRSTTSGDVTVLHVFTTAEGDSPHVAVGRDENLYITASYGIDMMVVPCSRSALDGTFTTLKKFICAPGEPAHPVGPLVQAHGWQLLRNDLIRRAQLGRLGDPVDAGRNSQRPALHHKAGNWVPIGLATPGKRWRPVRRGVSISRRVRFRDRVQYLP